mgnify:CR=1 FL=1
MKYKYLLLISSVLFACNVDKVTVQPVDDYNRVALLENLTENVIIPVNQNFNLKMISLTNAADLFTTSPNNDNFNSLRNTWVEAYVAWQHIEMFDMGKAEEIDYIKSMNTYPCNKTIIDANIQNSQYDLNDATWPSWASQGFPALDYMLYGLDSDSSLVINFYTGPQGNKYLSYLGDIIIQMSSKTTQVNDHWLSSKINFIGSSGNTRNSSLNLLTNDFIYHFEKGIRANKIGIPCGRWDNFKPYEKGVEAYYRRGLSKRLVLEALEASSNFFLGIGFNTNIPGESYINYLQHKIGDNTLSNKITAQMSTAISAVSNLDDDFISQMSTDNNQMLQAYDALQKVVVLLKTDMLINLSITVDYADTDGD